MTWNKDRRGGDRLAWIMRNRARRDRTRAAGSLLTELTGELTTEDNDGKSAAANALAAVVDGVFRRHCRVGMAARGTILIRVDEPGLVSAMRLRWSEAVSLALTTAKVPGGARRVLFEWGRSGAVIP